MSISEEARIVLCRDRFESDPNEVGYSDLIHVNGFNNKIAYTLPALVILTI